MSIRLDELMKQLKEELDISDKEILEALGELKKKGLIKMEDKK